MVELFNNIKKYIVERFSDFDKKKKIMLVGGSLILVVVVTALILMFTSTEYVVLASNLTLEEAAAIDQELTNLNIPNKNNNATEILVPRDQLSEAKMSLSIAGVYNKKDFSWTEAFNQSNITMTSAEKSKMYLLAQATELAQAIETIDTVEDAVVNLYVPDDSAYLLNDEMNSRASAVVRPKGSAKLSSDQVNGIKMILVNSVKGLSEENISIVDNTGRELTKSSSFDDDYQANSQYDLKTEIENRLKENLTTFLENIYGSKNIKIMPSVVLDFDSQETVSTIFEPPNEEENLGLIRSMSEDLEKVVNGTSGGAPGTDSNGGNTEYDEVVSNQSDFEKSSRDLNYELNEISTRVTKARGTISDISLAVIINTKVLEDEILTEEHKTQIEDLVSASAGLNTKVVEVSGMAFVDELSEFDLISSTDQSGGFNILLIVGVVLIFIIAIGLVIFYMRSKAKVRETELEQKVEEQKEALGEIETTDDDASSPKYQINKFIDKNPEAVAQLLRTWINEG